MADEKSTEKISEKPGAIDPDKMTIKILMVVKSVKSFEKVEQFLTRRGWPTKLVDSMQSTIQCLVEETPHFVLVSVNHPSPKISKMPTVLASSFNTTPIVFGESIDNQTRQKLDRVMSKHKMYDLPSGPSIHRKIKMILLEQNAALQAETQKGDSGSMMTDMQSEMVRVSGQIGGEGKANKAITSEKSIFGNDSPSERTAAPPSFEAETDEKTPRGEAPNENEKKSKLLSLQELLGADQDVATGVGEPTANEMSEGEAAAQKIIDRETEQGLDEWSASRERKENGEVDELERESNEVSLNYKKERRPLKTFSTSAEADEFDSLTQKSEFGEGSPLVKEKRGHRGEAFMELEESIKGPGGKTLEIKSPDAISNEAATPEAQSSLKKTPSAISQGINTSESKTLRQPQGFLEDIEDDEAISSNEIDFDAPELLGAEENSLTKDAASAANQHSENLKPNDDLPSVMADGTKLEYRPTNAAEPMAPTINLLSQTLQNTLAQLDDRKGVLYPLTLASSGWAFRAEGGNLSGFFVLATPPDQKLPKELINTVRSELTQILEIKAGLVFGDPVEITYPQINFASWASGCRISRVFSRGQVEIGVILIDRKIENYLSETEHPEMLGLSVDALTPEIPTRFPVQLYLKENKRHIVYLKPGAQFSIKQFEKIKKFGVKWFHVAKEHAANLERYLIEKVVLQNIREIIQSKGFTTDSNSDRMRAKPDSVEDSNLRTKTG